MVSEVGLGRTLVFSGLLGCPVGKKTKISAGILLDYIFNICFALAVIVRVRLILEGGLREQF